MWGGKRWKRGDMGRVGERRKEMAVEEKREEVIYILKCKQNNDSRKVVGQLRRLQNTSEYYHYIGTIGGVWINNVYSNTIQNCLM